MEENKPLSLVTVKNKITLFKNEEQANAIEYIELEEVGNKVVAQKGLYEIGEKCFFIEPDYCIPNNVLFKEYHKPGGDPRKCMLGANGRIKAKKFTLHTGNGEHIYSYGILIPYVNLIDYLNVSRFKSQKQIFENIDKVIEHLGIVKYEEVEKINVPVGRRKKGFPSDLYMTDETNINKLWNAINFPIQLTGRVKEDGSSITIYYKNSEKGICSRRMEIPIMIDKVVGRRNKTLLEKIMFWTKPDLNIYETVKNDDIFINTGLFYLEKLEEYCVKTKRNLVLRGELNGKTSKGSGNKNNPAKNRELNIRIFGIDEYNSSGVKRLNENDFLFTLDQMGLLQQVCEEVFCKTFNSREELENECNAYFKNNLIEGIVVRNFNHSFSAKIMNLEYDSKK